MQTKQFNEKIQSIIAETKIILNENPPHNEINIFLCGGASRKQAEFRFKLGEKLGNLKSKNKYNIFYPETLFAELSNGYQKKDLLTLENLLAKSVSSIVIPLESPGTFAELGAFSNHPLLKDKLIIIIDQKYKNSKSFISKGPIAQLKKSSNSRIFYYEMIAPNIDIISYKIAEASRTMAEPTKELIKFDNPLHNMLYYFLLIYIFDPISEKKLIEIMNVDIGKEDEYISFITVLSHLSSIGKIRMERYPFYSISNHGFEKYLSKRGYTSIEIKKLQKVLQKIRIEAINITYRKSRSWEEED